MILALTSALGLGIGTTLLLSGVRWIRRPSLVARLHPYSLHRGEPRRTSAGVLSVGSLKDVVGPLATDLGARLARLAGVDEAVSRRLDRVHADTDPTAFRLGQLGWSAVAAAAAAAGAVLTGISPGVGLISAAGGAALGFLLVEHRLGARSATWQDRVVHELPVVAEQLGMLLSSGYSLGGALNRLARRGTGAIGTDLGDVTAQIRHGVAEATALVDWAERVDVDGVRRLVAVLALDREAGDLGRLVSEEARALRADVQRTSVETIERRAQQVWIPVTVATLVPGVLFMAVPFVHALRSFAGT